MKVYRYSSYTRMIYGLFTLFSILVSIAFLVFANGILFFTIIGIFGLAGALVGEAITLSFCYRLTNESITVATFYHKTVIAFDNIDHIKYFTAKKNDGIFIAGQDSRIIITNQTGNYKEMINEIMRIIADKNLHVNIDPDVYIHIRSVPGRPSV